MDLQSMAVGLLKERLGATDDNALSEAITSLLGGSGTDLDVTGLVQKLSGGSLGGALASWLGDGDNDAVGADQITEALGTSQIADFASQLGVGTDDAAGALSSVLPQLIDKSSSGGDLIGNVAGLASKLFR